MVGAPEPEVDLRDDDLPLVGRIALMASASRAVAKMVWARISISWSESLAMRSFRARPRYRAFTNPLTSRTLAA